MREKRSGRDKIEGRKQSSAVARGVVICVVAAVIGFSAISIPVLAGPSAAAAVQTGVGESETVEVKVNAPEYVESTFTATIDVDNVTNLNSGQFDLSFDESVVNVTDVRAGEINGTAVPVFMWSFVDADTVRVLVSMPVGTGASGSGGLGELEFEVRGKSGDKSELHISKGLLVDIEAKEIEADWHDGEVTVKIEMPSVTVETDKAVYEPGETQKILLTVANPMNEAVLVKLGMGFHAFEIAGEPFSYAADLFETELFLLPANYEESFVLPVEGLVLPNGKYAWSAYLKNAVGMKISESEVRFSVVGASSALGDATVPTVGSPRGAVFEDLSAEVRQVVSADAGLL